MQQVKIFDDYILYRMNSKNIKSGISTYISESKFQLNSKVVYSSDILRPIKNRTLYYVLLSFKLILKNYHIIFPFAYLPPGIWKRSTIIVHDIRCFNSYNFKNYIKQVYWLISWRLASKIKCVSNFTKNSVIKIYDSKKVEVFYCPYNWKKIKKSSRKKSGWLYVGHIEERKNTIKMLEYFIENKIKITIIGRIQMFSTKLDALLDSEFVNYLGVVSDSERNKLFKNFKNFINPSFYEGFSYTPVEALNYNMNLFLSDIEVHNEIYSNCATFFNPYNFDINTSQIKSISRNSKPKYTSDYYEIFS